MLHYHATLTRRPYPDEVIPAELPQSPQLFSEDDFRAYRALSKPDWVPILVSFGQKYRLMDTLLGIVNDHLDHHFDTLLMSCRVPGTMRFPDRFNSAKVFLVADIQAECLRLDRRGTPYAAISEGIIRHPMEEGQNEFTLRLSSPGADAAEDFARCCDALTAAGLTPVPGPERHAA